MSKVTLELDHVSKKFKKGIVHDSLRDLIPALVRGIKKSNISSPLNKNEFWALQDICFSIKTGDALGVIGSNGAGKSTMLKLLCGIMKPTKGNIRIHGTISALIDVGAGFHLDLTGRENIYLNGTILGMKRKEIDRKIDEIIDFSGLEEFIDTPVKRYSSGMYARLGFSVAAHVDPQILIVDEVLSVGDYAFQNKSSQKMKSVLRSGTTLIFVSHNMRAVAELCDRCIYLDHGKLIADGEAGAVIKKYMDPSRAEVRDGLNVKDAYIADVVLRGGREGFLFNSGDKAILDISVVGNVRCDKLHVIVAITDNNHYHIFDTSTQLLNNVTFSLLQGEQKKVTFELNLHLVPGIYYVRVVIRRSDNQLDYDERQHAATFHVQSDIDVRGVVNLYPTVLIE